MRLLIAVLAVLAGLATAEPALAHLDATPRGPAPAVALERGAPAALTRAAPSGPEGDLAGIELMAGKPAAPSPADDARTVAWIALLAGLAAVALGRRPSRRAVAAVLVVLLAVFAFENGLHSVHHGGDKHQLASCPLSAVSIHLSATVVDQIVCSEAILRGIGAADVANRAAPLVRPITAHLGRAPPTSIV